MLEDPALLARHTAALKLLRQGREVDGILLLSYVVWPSPNLDAARAAAERRTASSAATRERSREYASPVTA